jgi:phospholipid N-methyltransferase
MRFFSDWGSYLRESKRNFHDTGSLMPSSRFLAQAMVSELRKKQGPSRILEVGPGTGPVTRYILRSLTPEDRLDLAELNGRFFETLREKFQSVSDFARHKDQVQLMHTAVEQVPGEGVYDYIISGLPLANFAPDHVREIFRVFRRLLKPGGTVSYFEYLFIRNLKAPFVGRVEKRRLRRVGMVVSRYIRDFQIRNDKVFINLPPAVVRHMHLKPAAPAS